MSRPDWVPDGWQWIERFNAAMRIDSKGKAWYVSENDDGAFSCYRSTFKNATHALNFATMAAAMNGGWQP